MPQRQSRYQASIPEKLVYTKTHEWVRQEGDEAVLGITDYAQHAMGDIVFVELPAVGKTVSQGDTLAVVESVKAAEDVYAPLGGEVTGINEGLEDDAEKVNRDPYKEGWFLRMKLFSPGELEGLLDSRAYLEWVREEEKRGQA